VNFNRKGRKGFTQRSLRNSFYRDVQRTQAKSLSQIFLSSGAESKERKKLDNLNSILWAGFDFAQPDNNDKLNTSES